MEKILISACLIGDKTRYDGKDNRIDKIDALLDKYELIPFCPEFEGGLSIPRNPSEIIGQNVKMNNGKDVSSNFNEGAVKAVMLCQYLKIKIAILKERSPSCGVHEIYDGSFSRRTIDGNGITTRKLVEAGIKVYSENEIYLLLKE